MGQAASNVGGLPKGPQLAPGEPRPRGCSQLDGGAVNFALDAPGSQSAWLVLALSEGHPGLEALDAPASGAERCFQLNPDENRSGDTWHVEVTPSFPAKGAKYAWLLDPPLDGDGQPSRSATRIIDPCAHALDSPHAASWNNRGSKKYSPSAVVPDHRVYDEFNWEGVQPPGHHLKDLVIYEAHVRGFTKNPDSGLSDWDTHSGTFTGFVEKIPYLLSLGVNAVELLPVFEYDETACPRRNPHNGEQLCNYWGYSTVAFCTPMQRFASGPEPGRAIVGFKTMVRELHRHGIEVILDVVFNHTAEGTWGEHNWSSMEAIARERYYLTMKGKHTNYTGCGNTVNANDPLCADWICHCLRFWVEEMHVDGFRFDLASALCRGRDGRVMSDPELIRRMVHDPALSRAKLIAEPWDCSWPDGYLVGRFPSCGPPRFAEWNGKFRDTVRSFIKGEQGKKSEFATRICGSSDLFKSSGRAPFHSINFVTAHDGFTLRDLVSYNGKHNEANGEQSGDDHNNSWNCGHEGETGDGGVKHLRAKQMRNFMVALLCSAGTPMLVFGDEYGRSQRGNNNTWCQDALNWFSWSDCAKEDGNLVRFTRLLISMRKKYGHIFNRTTFYSEKDIWWRVNWDDPYNFVSYILHDRQAPGSGLLFAFNAGHEHRHCELPTDRPWYRIIDTNLASPDDFCETESTAVKIDRVYHMAPYSCLVLKCFGGDAPAIDYSETDTSYIDQQDVSAHLQRVINRRMSMHFTSRVVDEEEDAVMSMLRRRSNMSGSILLMPGQDGDEDTFIMERSREPSSFRPPAREPEKPPARPAVSGDGDEALVANLGGARRVNVKIYDGEEEESKVLEIAVKGFGREELYFHWGAIEAWGGAWKNPPAEVLAATVPSSKAITGANQTLFPKVLDEGARRVFLTFSGSYMPKAVNFVLHAPPNQWIKHGNADFKVDLPESKKAREKLEQALKRASTGLPADSTQKTLTFKVLGFNLTVVVAVSEAGCSAVFTANVGGALMLHYGAGDPQGRWQFAKSKDFTPVEDEDVQEAKISLSPAEVTTCLMFVLKLGANHWVKNGAQDFRVELPEDPKLEAIRLEAKAAAEREAAEAKKRLEADAAKFKTNLNQFLQDRQARAKAADVSFSSFDLAGDVGAIDVSCRKEQAAFKVEVKACFDPKCAPPSNTVLHWGMLADPRRKDWKCPSEDMLPQGTRLIDAKACQTQFQDLGGGLSGFTFSVSARRSENPDAEPGTTEPAVAGMAFVLHVKEGNKWLKGGDNRDCVALFREPSGAGAWKGQWPNVAGQIVEAERDWGHMTLMHRYNLCRDLVDKWLPTSNNSGVQRRPSFSGTFMPRKTSSWSRMPSKSLLDSLESAKNQQKDDEFWSWIFVWQRLSYIKVLDWQRNYNTKPRELAGATDSLADKLCSVWKDHPSVRLWCRWTLATLGRGGNRGQEIRDEILHIMHRNKIPETAGHFYEQWHQKLHNNTTPDDIGICKALLAFLRGGGNMDLYWKTLRDNGITKERLASYDRNITKEPYLHGDTGRLIMEFENYLRILQSVHDALDLETAIEASKWCLPGNVYDQLQGILHQGAPMQRKGSRTLEDLSLSDSGALDGSHRKFMRLADARMSLLGILNDSRTGANVIRQLLLLDYSLETQQTVLIQGMSGETRLPMLCDQMQALLTAVFGHMPLMLEMQAVLVDWIQLVPLCSNLRYNNDPVESALLLKAMVDRLARVVGDQVDTFQTFMGAKANHIGSAVNAPKQVLDVFVDEVLRGSALFSVSIVLKRLEPQLRSIAHLPPWQMISAVDRPVHGELQVIDKMLHMQDKIFETPTVLLSGMVSGEEEVPVGVQAVLVRDAASAPDILSHCAVRARNSGVLLATCFDPEITKRIEAEFVGQWVEVRCKQDGTISVEKAQRPGADPMMMRKYSRSLLPGDAQEEMQSKPGETKLVNMNLTNDLNCKWCVTPSEMDSSKVGSKSLNLAKLAPMLPKEILTPQAVALPYGCMQKVLADKHNKQVGKKLEACLSRLQPTTSNAAAKGIFAEATCWVAQLHMPRELAAALTKAMQEVGDKEGERRLSSLYNENDAWAAIREVWASLFGLRPWVSLAKAGRSFHDLNMAVLVQELLPAKYAFVLHTKNPFTGDADEVYGEIVPGRGETLVGNFPGRALSFRAKKGQAPVVSSFLSKSTWLRTQECLIFRSDSNGEDLEGFAGAGLFESICAKSDIPCMVRFHRLKIISDPGYRQSLLTRLADVGRQVERAFGGMPQDIEGCVDPQDRIFIVQSRPQV